MAIGEKAKKNGGAVTEENKMTKEQLEARDAIFQRQAPEDWNDASGSGFLYRPDAWATEVNGVLRCWREGPNGQRIPTAPPIVGYPAGIEHREDKNGQYVQLYIRLAEPTLVKDADGNEFRAEAGDNVIITETYDLKRVTLMATSAEWESLVFLQPIQKETMRNGNSIWRWKVKEAPVRTPRVQMTALATSMPKELSA